MSGGVSEPIEPAEVTSFRRELIARPHQDIVRRYITYGSCSKLSDEQYYQLKHEISKSYQLHPSEVAVVGSAKLGFSIAPDKRYQVFNDKSDLDVAIVSSRLFDVVWKEVFNYSNEVTYWEDRNRFFKYLSEGWIRPDKLPRGKSFRFAENWFAFFRMLSNSKVYGEIKISAGLYKDWTFLEKYQEKSVAACADNER